MKSIKLANKIMNNAKPFNRLEVFQSLSALEKTKNRLSNLFFVGGALIVGLGYLTAISKFKQHTETGEFDLLKSGNIAIAIGTSLGVTVQVAGHCYSAHLNKKVENLKTIARNK